VIRYSLHAMEIDDVLSLLEPELSRELAGAPSLDSPPRHWIASVEEEGGIRLAEPTSDARPHGEILASLVDEGAAGAAYVSHFAAEPERVLADVLVASPRNTDIRQALIERDGESMRIGAWEYLV
jgi:hypothetical protein